MRLFWFALRSTASSLILAGTVAAAAVWLRLAWVDPSVGGAVETRASALTPWLHLPALAIAAAFCVRFVDIWPLLGRDRPGAQAVERVATGPLAGCGAVLGGSLVAAGLALALAGIVFCGMAAAFGQALPSAHLHQTLRFQRAVVHGQRALVAELDGSVVSEVRLRFVFFAAEGPLATELRFLGNGAPLHPDLVRATVARDTVAVSFSPRPLQRLEVQLASGAAVSVRHGGGLAIGGADRSAWLNAPLAACAYLPLLGFAGSLVVLLRRRIAQGVAKTLGVGSVLAAAVLGAGGADTSIADLGAGAWVSPTQLAARGAGLWGATALLLALASAGQWRARRGTRRSVGRNPGHNP